MIRNYLKTAFRNIIKHRTSSIINILGLSIGLASSFIILLHVYHELSFDRYPDNKKNIYRVITHKDKYDTYSPLTPFILTPNLINDYAEIDKISRVQNWPVVGIKKDDEYLNENGLISAENDLFELFSFEVLQGNPEVLLTDPYSIVISKYNAEKYFGNDDPIGQTMTIKIRNKEYDFNISGVIMNIPENSTLKGGFFTTIEFAMRYTEENMRAVKVPFREAWDAENLSTYISFTEKININAFGKKLEDFAVLHIPENMGQQFSYSLQPLKDIYLYSSHLTGNPTPTGNLLSIYLYSIIAIIILFVAGANYIILTISRDQKRNKEMCIRKVVGANKLGIIKQLLSESILVSLISMIFAFILIEIFLPKINAFLGSNLNIYAENLFFIFLFILIAGIIGIISGSYIAIYLSSMDPIDLLKGKFSKGRSGFILRRVLITSQIIIFVVLIFCSFVIKKQLNYTHSRDLGFNKEGLIIIQSPDQNFVSKFNSFKNEIKKHSGVINVSGGLRIPPKNNRSMSYTYKGVNFEEPLAIEMLYVDGDFIKTFEIELLLGRDFNETYNHDSAKNIIVNQAAVEMFGFTDPIGQQVGLEKILGVVENFHIHSLHEKVEPVMIYYTANIVREIAVKINPEDAQNSVNFIKQKWDELNPGENFDYQYFDDKLDSLYISESKVQDIAGFFTLISILIASMGLFGLSAFVSNHKTKEIGIRKVLGSSVLSVFKTITMEYVIICVIANVIALPLSWFIMNKWLQRFEYKTDINISVYITAIVLSLIIVVITMSYKTIRAANSDPANTLRHNN
ncbi:ABC transporter permease [Bacteroidota bacterium]